MNGTLAIAQANATITANDATRAYGAVDPTFTGSITGIRNGDPIAATYSTTATATSPAGTYPITAAPSDGGSGKLANYNVIITGGTLTITPTTNSGPAYLSGNDLIVNGTAGNDAIQVNASDSGFAVVVNGTSYGPFTFSGVIHVFAGDGDDIVTIGSNVARAADLHGEGGNDTLTGGAGNDTLDGGTGNDSLVAIAGNDILLGEAGNDTLRAGTGNDSLDGGTGDDSLLAGTGNDTIHGGAGNDTIRAGSGNDILYGDDGNDSLTGGSGCDTLDGGAGNDTIRSGSGTDLIHGGDGDDSLLGGAGRDTIFGGLGNDTISGDAGSDFLYGEGGNDYIDGGSGADVLVGGEGNDMLIGGAGNDLLIGGFGSDVLIGNAADDLMIAGYTDFDTNAIALEQILCRWTSETNYQTRIASIQASNFAYHLIADVTVHDDGAVDRLTGSAGSDWFFANVDGGGVRDVITDLANRETATDVV